MDDEAKSSRASTLLAAALPAAIGGVFGVLAALIAAPSIMDRSLPAAIEQAKLQAEHPEWLFPPEVKAVKEINLRLLDLASDNDRERARRKARVMARLGMIPPEWADVDAKAQPLTADELIYAKGSFEPFEGWARHMGYAAPSIRDVCIAQTVTKVGVDNPAFNATSKKCQAERNATEARPRR